MFIERSENSCIYECVWSTLLLEMDKSEGISWCIWHEIQWEYIGKQEEIKLRINEC